MLSKQASLDLVRSQEKTAHEGGGGGGRSAEARLVLLAILSVVEAISVFDLDAEMLVTKTGCNGRKGQYTVERAQQKGIRL